MELTHTTPEVTMNTTAIAPLDTSVSGFALQADWETKEKNGENYNSDKHDDVCYLCGRGLTAKAVENGYWIEMATDGSLVRNDQGLHPDLDSQGAFPVGSECAKKIPLTHRSKQDGAA